MREYCIGCIHRERSGFRKRVLLSSLATLSIALFPEKAIGRNEKVPCSSAAQSEPSIHIAKSIIERAMSQMKGMARNIDMIARKIGITPMHQLIRAIYDESMDKKRITIPDGSKSELDILLRSKLDDCAEKYSEKFGVHDMLPKHLRVGTAESIM